MVVTINMIVASFMCITVYTMLFGDNQISRIGEHIVTGVGAGYVLITNLDFFYKKGVLKMLTPGNAHYVIPVVLGILIYARLYPKTRWMYRYPIAVILGCTLGVAMRTYVFSQFVDQIMGNLPPIAPLVGVPTGKAVSNLIVILGSICATIFFVFSRDFTGPSRYIHRIGRLFLLCAFGATYGNTVSYRYELMSGTFISNMFQPPELVPYTMGYIAVVAVILLFLYKKGYSSWN